MKTETAHPFEIQVCFNGEWITHQFHESEESAKEALDGLVENVVECIDRSELRIVKPTIKES